MVIVVVLVVLIVLMPRVLRLVGVSKGLLPVKFLFFMKKSVVSV